MQNYPKIVFNHKMTTTDDKVNVGFHISHLKSLNSFQTMYYDVTCEKNRIYISKDDIKATKLSGFNYHPNAEIRSIVIDESITITKEDIINLIEDNLSEWVSFLYKIRTGSEYNINQNIERFIDKLK